ncbi:MAG TPA: N-acetylglucosamine-6-phosphate deacetylase [Vicinamibacterales bacterium]|jgi:N-acetylglucosamine-6-phosphate deacetylase|nr:N-acetylglucosamine-6-phosphate deacetylase [Vicinamibacterales bacterium]
MSRIFLSGASIVREDAVDTESTLVLDGERIVDIVKGRLTGGASDTRVDLDRRFVVPGFVDAHVHGVNGVDVMDGDGAVARVAAMLPRWGVTAFCPTSIACAPVTLEVFLADVRDARERREPAHARVLPAHLESSFISPELAGAQPREWVCGSDEVAVDDASLRRDVLEAIDRFSDEVAIVTLAPERPGGLDLVRRFVAAGRLVSIGHSGATFEEACAAIQAGASRATHLFNAMGPLSHREPGVAGAMLAHDHVHVELICDGVHVHPAMARTTIAAKTPSRVVAITDGTAASGLPPGSRAHLGNRPIIAADTARLENGALAGSVLTMDRAFTMLVKQCHMDLVDAARMCATTPTNDLRLPAHGRIKPGAIADLVVLDGELNVERTYVGGRVAWERVPRF